MRTYITVSEAKTRLAEFIKKAADEGEEVVVSVNGKPRVVLVDFERYEGMLETLDLLSDAREYLTLLKRKAARSKRPGRPLDDVLSEIEKEILVNV